MSDLPIKAEQEQHTLYLDKRRNWIPQLEQSFYASKVFFLRDGKIGMEYGGRAIVRSIELWMTEREQEA
jgi:hypothetical protein